LATPQRIEKRSKRKKGKSSKAEYLDNKKSPPVSSGGLKSLWRLLFSISVLPEQDFARRGN
jgi:hypothetical protein